MNFETQKDKKRRKIMFKVFMDCSKKGYRLLVSDDQNQPLYITDWHVSKIRAYFELRRVFHFSGETILSQ